MSDHDSHRSEGSVGPLDQEDAPHVEDEGWLISYADLMTLLFGLFAMLFAFADFNDEDTVRIRREIAKYFGGATLSTARELANRTRLELGETPYRENVKVRVVKEGVEVTFITTTMFATGKAELNPDAYEPVQKLAELIMSSKTEFETRVEGHTDDNPVRGGGPFVSNWELSAARASSIVRILEKAGVNPQGLVATGHGETRPVFPNRDSEGKPIAENQAQNRRVVIKIVLPNEARELSEEKKPKKDAKGEDVKGLPGELLPDTNREVEFDIPSERASPTSAPKSE